MQRASGSGERTPLVQPTYVFESSLSRSYQKRLRHFQCAICVGFLSLLAVALLVTTSYSLIDADDDADNTTTTPNTVAPLRPAENLTAPQLMPLLKISWPLQGRPPPEWPGAPPTVDALSTAVKHGQEALKQRQVLESKRTPLDQDSPALRAQRAAATSEAIKPLADTAYAIEEATKLLFNRTSKQPGEAFQGPPINGSFPEPRYCQQAPPCPYFKYRTLDGSCNSLEQPYRWGVSRTPFRRVLPPDYGDGISSPRTATDGTSLPSARDVSVTVHRPSYAHDTSFTVMLAVWGQFIDHDITATALSKGENSSALSCCDSSLAPHPECFPVVLDADDPFYQEYNVTCMEFVRSAPCPTCFFGPREQMNQATAFIDGSTVYGYTHERASSLRLQAGGRLRMLRDGARELLPQATDPGDPCNTVEMNAMGRYCFETDPDDPCNTAEMNAMGRYCFETGKFAACIAKMKLITATTSRGRLRMLRDGARELLPQATDPGDPCNTAEMNAMGRYCFETGDDRANENLHLTTMHLIWARQHNRVAALLLELNPTWDDETLYQEARRIVGAQMQHITYSEFLPSILGSDVMFALNLTLLPAGHADVFDPTVDPTVANHFSAAAFRFAHTLLPGLIHNMDASTGTINYVQLHEMLFNPYALYSTRGAKTAVSSAMNTPVHNVDPHVTTELSNHLFERPRAVNSTAARRGPCGLDLVSLNIQRGRDHGLPAYPAWREHCGLSRPKTFEDLGEIFDDQSLSRICKIYKSVDDIDLYTGALAEEPKGRLLGPTLSCLLSDQFLRLKVGDRFWYETSDETVGFSIAQLDEIRKTTLAGVICSNEELLDQAQPRVMEAVGPTNPLVDCKELPQPDFTPWQENKIKKKKPTRR